MATKTFDRDQIIEAAIGVFRQYGYSATSMQKIVQVTGLKPGSLYLEFENKEGLFKASLDYYAQQGINDIQTVSNQNDDVLVSIRSILEDIIQQTQKRKYAGCFLVNTLLELSNQGSSLYKFASNKLEDIEQNYANLLKEVFKEDQAKAYASQLMTVIFGIRVNGFRSHKKEDLSATIEPLLPWLYA